MCHSTRNGGPYFTQHCTHTEADDSTFDALGGTQTLDPWFGQAKIRARGVRKSYPEAVENKVKESQWHHWVGGTDKLVEAGKVLEYLEKA